MLMFSARFIWLVSSTARAIGESFQRSVQGGKLSFASKPKRVPRDRLSCRTMHVPNACTQSLYPLVLEASEAQVVSGEFLFKHEYITVSVGSFG